VRTRLRIGLAATCVFFCLLFIALWVRSYKTLDLLSRNDGKGWTTAIGSERGSAYVIHMYVPNSNAGYVTPRNTQWQYLPAKARSGAAKFGWAFTAQKKKIVLPYYVPIAIAASLAVATGWPWLRRFSVRALLIVMTMMAVYLAALFYMAK
jgi:hypothetical protein